MAIGDTLQRIGPNDSFIFDANGNLVGIDNPRSTGTDAAFLTAAQVAAVQTGSNNRIAIVGDSYEANAFVTTAGTVPNIWEGNGGCIAMNEALGCPWDISYMGALSGTTSSQWLSNPLLFPAALASDAGHIWIGFPNNDAQLIGDYATTIANLSSMYAQAAAAGKQIKVTTRGALNSVWNVTQFGLAKRISDWIVATAKARSWPIMDIENAVFDPATGLGNTTLLLADLLHVNIPGFLFAAEQSVPSFIREIPRRAQRQNSPTNLIYNSAMSGAVSNPTTSATATIPGWAAYNSGGTQTLTASKVTRVDTQGQDFLRFQLTSGAAGDRQGGTQTIDFTTTRANSTAYVIGNTRVDSNGNLQRCITAGTTAGTAPTWATTIGTTTADGTATWERVTNVAVGSTINIKADYDISSVSGGDLSAQLTLLINFTGAAIGNMRAHSSGTAAATPGQRHIMTKTGRPGLMTPFNFVIPPGATAFVVFYYFTFSAAAVTATCDMYGLECRIS